MEEEKEMKMEKKKDDAKDTNVYSQSDHVEGHPCGTHPLNEDSNIKLDSNVYSQLDCFKCHLHGLRPQTDDSNAKPSEKDESNVKQSENVKQRALSSRP